MKPARMWDFSLRTLRISTRSQARLKEIPEVVECHFTTGQYDMFIKLYAKNNHHLLEIIHDKLQNLGLARTESIISFKEVFKRQIPIIEEDND